MKHLFFPTAVLLLFFTASCSRTQVPESEPVNNYSQVESGCVPGHIRVKFKKEVSDTKAAGIDFSALGSFTMTRTFPPAGKWEERHRRAGLHLWYDIYFDPSLPVTKACSDLSTLPDVDIVEPVPQIKTLQETFYPFNDPDLPVQWHYHNPGGQAQWAEGCDINAFRAWTIETGKPEVIVAVSDTGVDYTHEDLAANMWINQAELNGLPAVDDDKNGCVDDIYGYNFLIYSGTEVAGKIAPGDHGTHVAGTIAAVNNNGIGVCGVAGGDGTPGSGVRIMSVQMVDESHATSPAFFAYAADNGAVVMNCSWGYTNLDYTPDADLAGMEYFTKYAGIGLSGEQTGPMAGGLLVFAAGNESRDWSYPAQEEIAFSVAALSANYIRSYFTSYGTWVDISAPGGDATRKTFVYSTIVGNQYGDKQGSSMAAPHVTGVSALLVSHYGVGRKGFTRDKLIYLLQSTSNKNALAENGSYANRLGSGLVDAYAALTVPISPDGPALPADVKITPKSNFLNVDIKVPVAVNGELPYAYDVFYSEKSLEKLDPDKPGSGVGVLRIIGAGTPEGEYLSGTISGLKFNTDYHYRVCSENIMNGYSTLSADQVIKTGANSKPVVTPLDGTEFQIPTYATVSMRFKISDPDGHPLTATVKDQRGLLYTVSDDLVIVTVSALSAEEGKTYETEVDVNDGYETTVLPFRYTILKNNPPVVIATIPDQIYTSTKEVRTFTLSDYFTDPDGETLKYSVERSTTAMIVETSIENGILTVKGNSYGLTGVKVTASDARHTEAELNFRVLVRNAESGYDIYPNPFKDYLNLRSGDYETVDFRMVSRAGATVFEQSGLELNPFDPVLLDLRSLPGGVYYAFVGSHRFTVVKQ